MKTNRKPWMKTATTFKWSRDGNMTQETANEQRAADSRRQGIGDFRSAVYFNVSQTIRQEFTAQLDLPKNTHVWDIDTLDLLIRAARWCAAWDKPVDEFLQLTN